ncbi:hypothetical protein PENTCL1PPCAC_9941, partial [Pristionchus entomophagus]
FFLTRKGLEFHYERVTDDLTRIRSQTLTVKSSNKNSYQCILEEISYNIRGVLNETLYLESVYKDPKTKLSFHIFYKTVFEEKENGEGLSISKIGDPIATVDVEMMDSPHYLKCDTLGFHTLFSFEGEEVTEGIDLKRIGSDYTAMVVSDELVVFMPMTTPYKRTKLTVVFHAENVELINMHVREDAYLVYTFAHIKLEEQYILKINPIKKTSCKLKVISHLKRKSKLDCINQGNMVKILRASDIDITYQTMTGNVTISNLEWEKDSEFIVFSSDDQSSFYKIEKHFDKIQHLGTGGFAKVLKVRSKRDFFNYALKIVVMKEDNLYSCSKRELLAMVQFNHPGIIRVHEWFIRCVGHDFERELGTNYFNEKEDEEEIDDDDDVEKRGSNEVKPEKLECLFLLLEVCTSSLENWLTKERGENGEIRIKLKELSDELFAKQLSSALRTIHDKKIIHRDITPMNIFVFGETDSEGVKIGDFGACRFLSSSDGAKTAKLTNDVGQKSYESPEQREGKDYSLPSDIFALGFVFVRMYLSTSTASELSKVFEALRVEGDGRTIPDVLKQMKMVHLIMDMTHSDPLKRPTAEEVRSTLIEIYSQID